MRLGLGLAALGRPGYMTLGHADDLARDYRVGEMERRCHQVLDAAYASGARHFDAARSYGRAEAFLASWLAARGLSPDAVTVSSKWGYTYTADWRTDAEKHEVKDHTLATFTRQLQESRALLGKHLSIYQVHSATLESGILGDAQVLDALARLRADGVAIGLTTTGAHQAEILRRVLPIERDDAPLFTWIQSTWNLLEPSAGHALADAHAAGRHVIIKEPLANGRLTARHRDPEVTPLLDEARRLHTTPDALALACALAQPWAEVVLSGAATVEHWQSNARATEVVVDERSRTRLSSMQQPAAQYWATRSRLAWT